MKQLPVDIIKEISDQLGSGFRVFFNRETLDVVSYPNEEKFLSFEPSMWKKEIQAVQKQWHNFIEIEGMEPHDSFGVMEAFVATVDDNVLRERLLHTIRQKRPFAHLKSVIDASDYRQRWFSFRDQSMLGWVRDQLERIPK